MSTPLQVAINERIIIPPMVTKPSRDEVLLRLQALRYEYAQREPLPADAPLTVDTEVTFSGWCEANGAPLPLTALDRATLPLGFAPFDEALASALIGRKVGETFEVARTISRVHPYQELHDTQANQRVRIDAAQSVVLPSEQDPTFWKATGLGSSLEAVCLSLMEQSSRAMALSARQHAATYVLLMIAERIGVNVTDDALAREAAMLFEIHEVPRWNAVSLPDDLKARAKQLFVAAPSSRSWATRELCAHVVLTRMMEESLIDRSALEAALKTLRPPPALRVEMTARAAEILGAAVVSAAWVQISDQLLALPSIEWSA